MKHFYTTVLSLLGVLHCSQVSAQSTATKTTASVYAEQVGKSTILFPTLTGFFRVTPDMKRYFDLSSLMTPEKCKLNAFFLQDSMAKHVFADSLLYPKKNIRVQSLRHYEVPDNVDFKEVFRDIKAKAKGQMNESYNSFIVKANKTFIDKEEEMVRIMEYDSDPKVLSMVPVNGYEDTPLWFSYGMFLKNQFKDTAGKDAVEVKAATMSIVAIKRQVVFVYVYAEKDQMAWAKKITKAYLEALVAVNTIPVLKPNPKPIPAELKRVSR